MQLNPEEKSRFYRCIENNKFIFYKGVLNPSDVISTLKKYDLFVFPTLYHGEGAPGVIIESFISGTPVLSSSFSQANDLISNQETGILFNINDQESLVSKLNWCIDNKRQIFNIGCNAQDKSKIYTREYNEKYFIDSVLGLDKEEKK